MVYVHSKDLIRSITPWAVPSFLYYFSSTILITVPHSYHSWNIINVILLRQCILRLGPNCDWLDNLHSANHAATRSNRRFIVNNEITATIRCSTSQWNPQSTTICQHCSSRSWALIDSSITFHCSSIRRHTLPFHPPTNWSILSYSTAYFCAPFPFPLSPLIIRCRHNHVISFII